MVEQHLGAEDVGHDELGGPADRAVDVRLRGEVHDRVAPHGGLLDGAMIGDVALVELVGDPGEVLAIPGVGQLVEHDDLVLRLHETADEVRADEPGAAGDEHAHRANAR